MNTELVNEWMSDPILQLFLTLTIVAAFILGLSVIVGLKIGTLLEHLKKTLNLEFRDVIGRISLGGTILVAGILLVFFLSAEGMEMARAVLRLDSSAINNNFPVCFVGLCVVFLGDLVVLAILKRRQ
ncbi:MAG: hypothetical protein ACREDR_17745 [Blastocatellia bacterium]